MATAKNSKAVEKRGSGYLDEDLASIKSFGDALELVKNNVGESGVLVADEVLGNGFRLLENKDGLLGTPMLLVSWDFHTGDHGEFCTVHLVTEENKKYVINDGSSGICAQLRSLTSSKNQYGGMLVRNGLRRSDYEFEDDNGQKKPAKTYYLDVSA